MTSDARLVRLARLGRAVRVGLVGCCKKKLTTPGEHRAEELYQGNFFRKALPLARVLYDEVWILSALHGLVAPDQRLEAYEQELPTSHQARAAWGRAVLKSLADAYPAIPLHLVFLAGAPYVEGVTGYDASSRRYRFGNNIKLHEHGWTWEHPLAGCDRAARYRWFADQARGRVRPS